MLAALCIFCTLAAGFVHGYIGEPGGLAGISAEVGGYLMGSSIALWIQADAQRRGRRVAYDFDTFMFVFWPFAAPAYLVRTRGWRAFGPLLVFIVVAVAAALFAVVLGYPASVEGLTQ